MKLLSYIIWTIKTPKPFIFGGNHTIKQEMQRATSTDTCPQARAFAVSFPGGK